ncbi:TPA: hypothetical protein DF272_03775 [Candidatus Falkowbacteria bacterium]|nr:hypothetical protein [Candidatus Falkowbacteria bacterium]
MPKTPIWFLLSIAILLLLNPTETQAVATPTGQSCTATSECDITDYCSSAPNSVCTTKLATGSSTPCLNNDMCQSNYCDTSGIFDRCEVNPNPPAPTPAACTSSADCGLNQYCNTATPRACTAQLNDNAIGCTSLDMCQSGNCNLTNSTCEPAAGTPDVIPAGSSGLTPSGNTAPTTVTTLPNPLRTTSINLVIGRIIRFVIGLSGALALVVFIYGGFQWIFSQGKSANVEKGKKAITYSIIGLVIIFTSYIVLKFITSALTSFT